tara:strand:- start:706 stop:915 length:210 start_codon:yes stop_codon:yes gene_type:complete
LAQSKSGSAIEATCNAASGFAIAWALAAAVIPLFEPVGMLDAAYITALFSVVSWLRSYFWRRFFNVRLQ